MPGRNAYCCKTCGAHTVTVDVDEGHTPPTLGCRVTPGCKGYGLSLDYPTQWPTDVPTVPTHEWYKPDTAQLDRLQRQRGPLWEHVHRGGLLLRRRRGA